MKQEDALRRPKGDDDRQMVPIADAGSYFAFAEAYLTVEPIAEFLQIELEYGDVDEDEALVGAPTAAAPLTEARKAEILARLPVQDDDIIDAHVEWRRCVVLPPSRWLVVKLVDGREFSLDVGETPLTEARKAEVLAGLPDPDDIVNAYVESFPGANLRTIRWLVVKLVDGKEFGLYVDEVSITPQDQIRSVLFGDEIAAATDDHIEDVLEWFTFDANIERQSRGALIARDVHVVMARFCLRSLLSGYMGGEVDYERTLHQAELLESPALQPEPHWLRNSLIELMRGATPRTLNRKRPLYPTWLRGLAVEWVLFYERREQPLAMALESVREQLAAIYESVPSAKTLHSWYLRARRTAGSSRRRGRPSTKRPVFSR